MVARVGRCELINFICQTKVLPLVHGDQRMIWFVDLDTDLFIPGMTIEAGSDHLCKLRPMTIGSRSIVNGRDPAALPHVVEQTLA